MKKIFCLFILLFANTLLAETAPTLVTADYNFTNDMITLKWLHSDPIPNGGYDIVHNGKDPGTWRQAENEYVFGPVDSSISHCFQIEARYSDGASTLRSNELCATKLGPKFTENAFLGYTKYFFTGEQRKMCWKPHPDNMPWEGNYVFDVEVYHYERKELIHAVYLLDALETNFTLPRTGHYWARARTCKADAVTDCSGWGNSFDINPDITTRTKCDGSPSEIPADLGWWMFGWVGAPSFPD